MHYLFGALLVMGLAYVLYECLGGLCFKAACVLVRCSVASERGEQWPIGCFFGLLLMLLAFGSLTAFF